MTTTNPVTTKKLGTVGVVWHLAISPQPLTILEIQDRVDCDITRNSLRGNLVRASQRQFVVRRRREVSGGGPNPYEYTLSALEADHDTPQGDEVTGLTFGMPGMLWVLAQSDTPLTIKEVRDRIPAGYGSPAVTETATGLYRRGYVTRRKRHKGPGKGCYEYTIMLPAGDDDDE